MVGVMIPVHCTIVLISSIASSIGAQEQLLVSGPRVYSL